MFVLTANLCLCLLYVVHCDFVVTINDNGSSKLWHQAKFENDLEGGAIPPEINVLKLLFPTSQPYFYGYERISNIMDFPNVTKIILNNFRLKIIPTFTNLPNLKQISLYNNEIVHISSESVSQVPANELVFSSNNIATIDDGAFGVNVTNLYLTCNNLTTLSLKWFRNTQIIEQLNLGGNRISEIPENMFKDFVNLKSLELRNNQLVTLGVGAISGPRNMNVLHLGYNNISEIKPSVFGSFTEKIVIKYLDVQYNRLSFLDDNLLDKLKVDTLKIWGNPWQCPCKDKIYDWLNKNRDPDAYIGSSLVRDGDPSCVRALSFANKCIPYVDDELYEEYLKGFEPSPVTLCRAK